MHKNFRLDRAVKVVQASNMTADVKGSGKTPDKVAPGLASPEVGSSGSLDLIHEIGSRLSAADPLHEILERVVELITDVVQCDSCFIYVLEGEELALRASKNPHPEVVDRLKLKVGQGITGWVAKHRQPVAVPSRASEDPRFQAFSELPEDRYEAFLSVPIISRGRLVGIINLQHRKPHHHTSHEIRWVSTIGFLVGSEIEMARLDSQVTKLSLQLETRKLVERAKGILQRELQIDEEQAYLMLQRQSRQRRITMKEVAEAIVLADEVKIIRKPEDPN
jgi:uroporphyrinogen-III synthase